MRKLAWVWYDPLTYPVTHSKYRTIQRKKGVSLNTWHLSFSQKHSIEDVHRRVKFFVPSEFWVDMFLHRGHFHFSSVLPGPSCTRWGGNSYCDALGLPLCGCHGERGGSGRPCHKIQENLEVGDKCSESSLSGTLVTDTASQLPVNVLILILTVGLYNLVSLYLK